MGMKVGKVASVPFMKSFERLMKLDGVPPSTCFKLRGLAKIVQGEIDKYEGAKQDIISQHAEKDEQGNVKRVKISSTKETISIKPEEVKVLDEQLTELFKVEVEIPAVKVSDLGPTPALSPDDYFQLEFLEE